MAAWRRLIFACCSSRTRPCSPATCCLTSSCTFSISFGFLMSSAIAHSNDL
ncbi:hypothetical protein GQ55_3G204000 [Panicum hallii var. hallii]|uniref:Uncharacterized protein n=1 Tax=Panicum hallii var. hallii TaxID=1504633 RepID=A0A2T7EBI4_9POAL|nr:hypothetical protein GQ55_3G204000 [Panicum hallii var. hallii]